MKELLCVQAKQKKKLYKDCSSSKTLRRDKCLKGLPSWNIVSRAALIAGFVLEAHAEQAFKCFDGLLLLCRALVDT